VIVIIFIFFYPRGVGSSGNGLGLSGISWGLSASKARVLSDSCGEGNLYRFEVYMAGLGTQSGPALEEFLVIKKKKKK
jgi:hypothetical protein